MTESDLEFEDIERVVLEHEELDEDIYDRVGYLDEMKAHREERHRKTQRFGAAGAQQSLPAQMQKSRSIGAGLTNTSTQQAPIRIEVEQATPLQSGHFGVREQADADGVGAQSQKSSVVAMNALTMLQQAEQQQQQQQQQQKQQSQQTSNNVGGGGVSLPNSMKPSPASLSGPASPPNLSMISTDPYRAASDDAFFSSTADFGVGGGGGGGGGGVSSLGGGGSSTMLLQRQKDFGEDGGGGGGGGGGGVRPERADPHIRHLWAAGLDLTEFRTVDDQIEFRALRHQLGIDKISLQTLSHYNVKGHMDGFDHPALLYPRYRGPASKGRAPVGLKLIRRVGDKLVKENYPESDEFGKVSFSGIFGYHLVTHLDHRVVLTSNERDAMAVFDATGGILSLALPQGERFDEAVLPYLEDFDLIYIWFPNIHDRHSKDYASFLNASRCYIITSSMRPVELLRDNRGKDILGGIQDAIRVRYKGFRSMVDLRDSVKMEIVQSKNKMAGMAQWKRFELLNTYMRGFRSGEITVLTGGSYGKTTFLCEYAMDLYTQGIRTLFCNFEVPEEKILKWMIIQFSGPCHVRSLARSRTFSNGVKVPLHRVDHHSSVELWLDRFERTHSDLVVLKTDEFREKTIKEISEALRDQIVGSGVQHLVIDNLPLLINYATMHDGLSALEKANVQDRFVAMLRRLVNSQDLHVTLVVPPNTSNLGQQQAAAAGDLEVSLRDLGAPSSRIRDEADNVLAIQRRRNSEDRRRFRKFLYILKNRYGGRCVETDQIEMIYQPATYTHVLVESSGLGASGSSK